MDTHCRIAAGLNIALCLFELFVISLLAVFLSSIVALVGLDWPLFRFIAAFGGTLLSALAVIALVNLVAAIAYLRGSQLARIWLLLVNALMLLKFPLGTLVGGYTLWALLRPQAATATQPG